MELQKRKKKNQRWNNHFKFRAKDSIKPLVKGGSVNSISKDVDLNMNNEAVTTTRWALSVGSSQFAQRNLLVKWDVVWRIISPRHTHNDT